MGGVGWCRVRRSGWAEVRYVGGVGWGQVSGVGLDEQGRDGWVMWGGWDDIGWRLGGMGWGGQCVCKSAWPSVQFCL